MTNPVAYGPQDFQKMCRQAERDHESKRLILLMDRVKRQIAERANRGHNVVAHKEPVTPINDRLPNRSVPLER